MTIPYRPWGQLNWLLEKYPVLQWDLFGSFSTEERCLATRKVLGELGYLSESYLALILDQDSPYNEQIKVELRKRWQEFEAFEGNESEIKEHHLLERENECISGIMSFIENSCGNIILDISSLPKRFFFPAVKLILRARKIKNVIITYTIPEKYTPNEMAENYGHWMPLPMFGGSFPEEKDLKDIFVGAGHMAMGLPEQLEAIKGDISVHILIPFPGHPGSFKRTWEFVRRIERDIPVKTQRQMVNARDVSDIFNYLVSQTNSAQRGAQFAPYGPKPISLAMCIFACQPASNSAVYYTQPTVYPPDYSTGISMIDGLPEIYAYCLRLNGNDLYSIP